MTFTFSPATDRGKCRLLAHDTTDGVYGTDYEFTDADVDAMLELNSDSVLLAAASMCRVLAAKAISSSIALKIPGAIELDRKQIAKYYMTLAKTYEDRATGTTDTVTEFIDSFDYSYDQLGRDTGEHVGDV